MLYDVDGENEKDSAGSSVAMNTDGTKIIFGSPDHSSNGGSYYSGTAWIYEQTEYSANPSEAPTGNPTSIPSGAPSSLPSVSPSSDPSMQPSLMPSASPSTTPSLQPSSVPTNIPSHSILPSANPSSEHDRIFQIRTKFGDFGTDESDWCLTAKSIVGGVDSGIAIRRCKPGNKLQLWSTDIYNELRLSTFGEDRCINTVSKRVFIDDCQNSEEVTKSFEVVPISDSTNMIK